MAKRIQGKEKDDLKHQMSRGVLMNIIDKQTFEDMMGDIDRQLENEGVPAHSRPIMASLKLANKLKIDIPLIPRTQSIFTENDFSSTAIPWQINNWYQKIYSNKINIAPKLASIVFLIRGIPYRAVLPRVYGTVSISPFDYIEDLTPGLYSRLSKEEINEIATLYLGTFKAMNKYDSSGLPKINAVLTKLETAVNIIMQRRFIDGDSKWASLQFIEILLKSILEKNRIKYKKEHELLPLLKFIPHEIARGVSEVDIEKIQCNPGVRYLEIDASFNEAIEAHYASLRVFVKIMSAMFPDD